MERLTLDVWSDIACPWCWIGKRHLEQALADFPHRDAVDLQWRAFELDPSAPRVVPPDPPYVERLARKYRTTAEAAHGMMDRMTAVAAEDGLEMRFDRIRPGNTFDGHRLLHLALETGHQDALKERFFRAYLQEGEAIGERDVLCRLAVEVGLDEAAVTEVLESDGFTDEVRRDEATAQALGITGVPFFVGARKFGVSGAQPADVLREVLDRAWKDAQTELEVVAGAACGTEGC